MVTTTVDLLSQEYPSRATDQNQSTLINMYLEQDQNKGKYPMIALPTPGLTLFCPTGQANVRALYALNGTMYAVAGNQFGSVNVGGSFTQIGTLNTSSGFAKIKSITGGIDTNNQLMIADGTNLYTYNVDTQVLDFPISDVNAPQTAIDIENQDDYVLAIEPDSIQYQICNLSDTTTWDPLNFASKIGQTDRLVGLLSHESKIWLFGDKTSEMWYNSGDPDFPFARDPSTFLHYGLAAKQSLVANENYFMFLGINGNGGYSVYQTLPRIYFYNPMPVSTQPIDALIRSFGTTFDANAAIKIRDGHQFYEITFPTAGYTLCYDIPRSNQSDASKGAWFLRQSWNANTQTYTNFLGSSNCVCFSQNMVGDYNSGNIYYEDTSNYTENGTPILREIITPPLYKGGNRIMINRLQLDVQTGIGNNNIFTLEKSMDNGNTWQLVNTYTVPPKGMRIYENRIGSSRFGIIFRIRTTMNAEFIVLGFQADIAVGHS